MQVFSFMLCRCFFPCFPLVYALVCFDPDVSSAFDAFDAFNIFDELCMFLLSLLKLMVRLNLVMLDTDAG